MGNDIILQSYGTFFKNILTIGEVDKKVISSRLEDKDSANKRTCYLTYADYKNDNAISFSTNRSINVVDKKKLGLKMDFKQFEFNEKLSFPFSVPKNYSRN
jgi:hypothetical protein